MSHLDLKSENCDSKKLYWNCCYCTFENKAESFKCKMCHLSRGSSSRHASVNTVVNTHQYILAGAQNAKKNATKSKDVTNKVKTPNAKVGSVGKRGKLTRKGKISNIDRKSGRSLAITVNNVTVNFTEYNLKANRKPSMKNKKRSVDLCLVASEDSSSKSSFTSQSESLLSYNGGVSNEKMESN